MNVIMGNMERRETWAEALVLGLVALALLAGWALRGYAVWRTSLFAGETLSVSYTYGWTLSEQGGTVRFRDMRSGGIPAEFAVRAVQIVGITSITQTLAFEGDAMILSRAAEMPAYRVLESDSHFQVQGQPALRISYAFVHDDPNAFQQHLPVIMLGEDVLTYQREHLIVFSLQAPEADYSAAQRRFYALVESARIR